MVSKQELFDLGKKLTKMSSENGDMGFSIKYTATDGNLRIHEDFIKFCFDNSNNEFLQGIKLLLDSYKTAELISDMAEYLSVLDLRVSDLKNEIESLQVKDNKDKRVF
jgi:hypothetical protein